MHEFEVTLKRSKVKIYSEIRCKEVRVALAPGLYRVKVNLSFRCSGYDF